MFHPPRRTLRSPAVSLAAAGVLALTVMVPSTAYAAEPGPSPQRAAAAATAYTDVELQARTNLLVNDEGFNLPPGSSFNSVSPDIADDGAVAFRVNLVPDKDDPTQYRPGVWYGGHGEGGVVYTGGIGAIVDSDATLNNAGQVAFTLSDTGFGDDLYRYDATSGTAEALDTSPVLPNSYGDPSINAEGDIGFRASFFGGKAYAAYIDGEGVLYAGDDSVTPGSPYTYLYSAAFNDAGQIAAKVATSDDLTSQLEIRLFEADGTSRLILANQAVDPDSPYSEFDNSLSVAGDGTVAVVATRAADDRRVVVRSDGVTTTEIAAADPAGTIRDIEFFPPDVNDAGQVAFRAVDANGQAIYVGDGTTLTRVIGADDVVQTDLGAGQIGQHDDSTVFGGAPAVNGQGDVVFTAALHPQGDDQVEWGTGVFVAYAGVTGENGSVEGVVTDANDGLPVPGATVRAVAPDDTVAAQATTGADGSYTMAAAAGTYTVTATAPDYASTSTEVTVDAGGTATADLALATPVLSVRPGSLDLAAGAGEVATAELTVENGGTADLHWSIGSDASWLTASPGSGTVVPGGSTTVTVTADSTGLTTGEHEATLTVSGDAARHPSAEVPVRLAVAGVSTYDVAVNVGGGEYVDGAGVTWLADRRHGDGPWGGFGSPNWKRVTTRAIAGTDDDPLYQDRRDGQFGYRFDDVPAGTYRIDLRFAEFNEGIAPGLRKFTIAVDRHVVLADHDIAAEVGRLTADEHVLTVQHRGGNLVIELRKQKGDRVPVLGALRVTGVGDAAVS